MSARFTSSIVRLSTANIALLAAQSATVLALGVIADPVGLGIFFLGQTTAQLVATFVTLRFDSAFPAAKTRRELVSLLLLALGSTAVSIVPTLGGMLWLAHVRVFEFQSLSGTSILAVTLLTALSALHQLGRYWAIRHGHLLAIERATYWRAATILALRLGIILAITAGGLNGVTLATGLLIAEIGVFVPVLAALHPGVGFAELMAGSNRAALRVTLKRNWIFPAVEAPSALIDSLTVNGPLYLVTQFFGLAATASFGLAYRAMAVPVGQLALAVTEAMQAKYSEWLRLGRIAEMKRLFDRSSALFAALGATGCLIAYFILEPVSVLLFGEKLRAFAQIAVVLGPWIAFNVTVNVNSRLIPLLKRQDLKLAYDGVSVLALGAAWMVQAMAPLGLVPFVAVMAVGQSIAYMVYWLLIRHALDRALLEVGDGVTRSQP